MSDIFLPAPREDPSANLNLTPLVPAVTDAPALSQASSARAATMAEILAPAPVLPVRTERSSPLIGLSAAPDRQLAQANTLTRAALGPLNTMADWFGGRSPFAAPGPSTIPMDPNRQKHLTSALNKVTELKGLYSQLPPDKILALINMDRDRINKGAPPLTRKETASAIKMLITGEQTTPDKERDPGSFFSNVVGDVGDIFRGLRSLPGAVAREAVDIYNIFRHGRNDTYYEERARGTNPFTAFLRSPGIRLIPGTYVAGELARGGEGVRELATHPLMTGLDVLPYASQAAARTTAGRAGAEISKARGMRMHRDWTSYRPGRGFTREANPRAIRDVLMNRPILNPDGTFARQYQTTLPPGVPETAREVMVGDLRVTPTARQLADTPDGLPMMERTGLGTAIDRHIVETSPGRYLQRVAGKGSRAVASLMNRESAEARAIYAGRILPELPEDPTLEQSIIYNRQKFLYDVGEFGRRVEAAPDGPEGFKLGRGDLTPEQEAMHAKLDQDLRMGRTEGYPDWFVEEYTELMDRAVDLVPDELGRYTSPAADATTEVYPIATYNRLRAVDQQLASRRARRAVADHILEPRLDATTARGFVDGFLERASDRVSPRDLASEARLITEALAQYGIDITTKTADNPSLSQLATAISRARSTIPEEVEAAKRAWAVRVRHAIDDLATDTERTLGIQNSLGPHPHSTDSIRKWMLEVEREYRSRSTTKPHQALRMRQIMTRLRDGLADPNAKHLDSEIKALHRMIPDLDLDMMRELRTAHARTKSRVKLDSLAPSHKRIAQAAKAAARFRARQVPARWVPLVERATRRGAIERLVRELDETRIVGEGAGEVPHSLPDDLVTDSTVFGDELAEVQGTLREGERLVTVTPDEVEHIALAIMEGRYAATGFTPEYVTSVLRSTAREVAGTWEELAAQGLDPVFVHNVSPQRLNEALHPNADPVPTKPSQVKERTVDLSPRVNSVQLAMTHQAMELVQRDMQIGMVDRLAQSAGWTLDQLTEKFRDEVNWAATGRQGINFEAWLQSTLGRSYVKLNPEEAGFSWGGTRLDKYSSGDIWIPRYMAENLKSYTQPKGAMTVFMEPVNNLFRANTIGLSPSVTINNAVSNMVMLSLTDPRAFTKFRKAWRIARDQERAPRELGVLLAQDFHAFEKYSKSWMDSGVARKFYRAKFRQGVSARNAWTQSITAAAEKAWAHLPAAQRATRVISTVMEKNIGLMELGDKVTRAMAWLSEYDRSLAKGIELGEAEVRAAYAATEPIINYLDHTPIERAAIRTLIPFYSYAAFAARFAMRFPLDHPVRVAMLAAVARVVDDDLAGQPGARYSFIPMPDWLPFLSQKGPDGSENFLSTRPFDALSGVGDMASLNGWFAATNPLITSAFESAFGVHRGEQDLFPAMEWDPEEGKMKPVRDRSLSGILLSNVAPRLQTALTPFGLNAKYNQLRSTPGNEDAAARSLVSGLGLPQLWQRRNETRDAIGAEMNRQKSQTQAINKALKTGDWSEASLYPGAASAQAQAEWLSENYGDEIQRFYGMSMDPAEIQAVLLSGLASGD